MVRTSYRTNLVTTLVGTWLTAGLMLDAWAHNNVPQLETFFTAWHLVFYTGFFATAAWIGWSVRQPLFDRRFRDIPTGYGAAVVGVAVFAVSAAGDMTWHLVFGIEQNTAILFSPTHLGLGASMVAILLAPVRAAWADRTLATAPRLGRLLPAVLSTALATTVVLLFLQYGNALVHSSGDMVVAFSTLDERSTSNLVTEMALTNLVLLLPVLALARRWTMPIGTTAIVYAVAAALSAAVADFSNVELMIGLIVAGLGIDLLVRWLRPGPQRPLQFRILAAAAPLLVWTVYIATAYATSPPLFNPDGTVEAQPELYAGAPVVQALLGLLAGILLMPIATTNVPMRGGVGAEPQRLPVDQPAVPSQ